MSPSKFGTDPSDPQSWNRYTYAGNDPIDFIDPSGNCALGADGRYHDEPGGPRANGGNSTVTTPGPGGSTTGPIPPGGCLDIVLDGILIGNTCAGGPSMGPTGETTATTVSQPPSIRTQVSQCAAEVGEMLSLASEIFYGVKVAFDCKL